MFLPPLLVLLLIVVLYLISSIKILAEYERGVVFRLGSCCRQPKGPGLVLVFVPSIGWCAWGCARSCTTCRRKT